jgi:hypothetical protein
MSAAPLFEPVNSLTPEQRRAPHGRFLQLLADARDIAGGAAEVFALVQREDLDANFADDDGKPLPALMSASMREELVRMASASLGMLVERVGDELLADAERAPSHHAMPAVVVGAELACLIPEAPCAGQMLTVEEAASLARLRELLQGKAVQQ